MASKSASFIFGRMNPPTVEGHGKGIQKVLDHAEKTGSTPYVFVSHSHDTKKNPVNPNTKVSAIQHSFPEANVQSTSKESPSIIHIMKDLNKKHNEAHVFAGSDRVDEYHTLLHKYNNKEYNYKKIVVHSIGQRDPDGESEEGRITSGTAARQAALSDPKKFHGGVLGSRQHHDEMIQQIRQAAMSKTSKSLREQFINNEIYNLHDYVVTKNGKYGEIVYKNSNYVTIQLENNETVKSWIYEIKETSFRPKRNGIQQPVKEKFDGPRYTFHFKQKANEQKIPALLIPSKKLIEESGQVKYQDYTTKNLDMDKDASKLLKQLVARTDLNPKYVKQAVMAVDKMFDLEKQAFANKLHPEKIHDFTMYASIAHDTLNMLGYEDKEIMFIQTHYIDFAKYVDEDDADLQDDAPGHMVGIHGGEMDEAVDSDQNRFVQQGRASPGMFKKVTSADYETRIGPGGKKYKVKKSIISKGHKLIDKDGRDNEPSGVPPFAGLSGMYESKMKNTKESYETPIKNLTHDVTKPENRVGIVPFSDYLKMKMDQKATQFGTEIGGSAIQEPPPKSTDKNIHFTSKSKSAKTAAKRIQMGLD